MRWAAIAGFVVWSLLCSSSRGQSPTAEAAITNFLGLNAESRLQAEGGLSARTGEAAEWDVDTIGLLPTTPDHLAPISESEAVARVISSTPQGDVDLYFYMRRDADGWRVSAMRTLSLTGLPYFLRDQLRAASSLTSEQEETLRNLNLLLSPDAALKVWLDANREALDDLASSVIAESIKGQALSDALAALGLTSITSARGAVDANIGGMSDNTVGFLREGASGPPSMSASDYIWVEDVGGGWFLYRTT